MATFDPRLQDEGADYSRYSQGQIPDKSGAINIFEGIDKTIGTVVTGVDNLLKGLIREDATQGVDQLRDREINQGSRQQGYGNTAGSTSTAEIDPVAKKAIDQNTARVGLAKEAAKTGQIGDSHYQLLLDAEARRLRARYPGYREYIDNVISDLTGGTPANKAIDLMKQENARLDPEDKSLKHEEDRAYAISAKGQFSSVIEYVKANGRMPPLAMAKKWNAEAAISDAQRQRTDHEASQYKNVDEANQRYFTNEYRGQILGDVDTRLRNTREGIGLDWDSLLKMQEAQKQEAASGRAITPETQQAFLQSVQDYRTSAIQAATNDLYKPVSDGKGGFFIRADKMGTDNAKRILDEAVQKIDLQIAPLINKDYSTFNFTARYNQSTEDAAIRDLQNKSNFLVRAQALQKAISPQVASAFLMGDDKALGAFRTAIKDYMIIDAVIDETGGVRTTPGSGQTFQSIYEKTAETMRKSGRFSQRDMGETKAKAMDTMIGMLQSRDVSAGVKKNLVNSLFNGDPVNSDFYATASPANKEILYQKLLDRKTTESVFATGDKTIVDNYTRWVDTAVGQRMLQHAADVREYVVNRDSGWQVQYDPTTHAFNPVFTGKSSATAGGPFNQPLVQDTADEANVKRTVRMLNRTVGGWLPVAKAMNMSPQAINTTLTNIFKGYGLNITKPIEAEVKK